MKLSKVIHLLNINDFFPEMCVLAMPLIQEYAKKIGADINIIKERKFPEWPTTYEKLQIFELGKNIDYNILFDLDLIVNPNSPDITELTPHYAVGLQEIYPADQMFYVNNYFIRDRRKIGVVGNLIVTTRYTHDFWTPLEIPLDIAKKQLGRHWILDEYTYSNNIAKFGLNVVMLENKNNFVHIGTEPYKLKEEEKWVIESKEEKIKRAKDIIKGFKK